MARPIMSFTEWVHQVKIFSEFENGFIMWGFIQEPRNKKHLRKLYHKGKSISDGVAKMLELWKINPGCWI